MKLQATARAHANIAFVKYWGKRDLELNLPSAGSLSLTLEGLTTTTTVTFGGTASDSLVIDGSVTPGALGKALRVMAPIRERAGIDAPVLIESENNFPTGAGLASSASGLAALTKAAVRAAGLESSLTDAELSALARLGSGSACRSIFGGYVQWQAGAAADGSDSHAMTVFPPKHWDLRALVTVVQDRPKEVGSTAGMIHTEGTSPYHEAFVAQAEHDLEAARDAIANRDLTALGRVAERSCLRMHAAMLAGDPPLIYLTSESWQVIEAMRRLRAEGVPLFFTADAGPNVKIFCERPAMTDVEGALRRLACVKQVIQARPGAGAEVVEP